METESYCLARAEYYRKLAVWADRKEMPYKAKIYRDSMYYFIDKAKEKTS